MAATVNKSLSRNSDSTTQFDSPNTPYRSAENSPFKQEGNSKAIVAISVDKFREHKKPPENAPPSGMVLNRSTREEPTRPVTMVAAASGGGRGKSRSAAAASSPPAGWKGEEMVRMATLGFRFSEVVLCLISFSVMAADRTQGWSGDSFDRYKEYRYCLSVNVIACAYSGLQACDLAYQLVSRKKLINHHLRYHFDFFMDQVLAYLLISASSSAATRVDDWQSNWGKDEFTEMASASVGMAFLAFIAFAISSLISGYNLCTRNSM